MPFICRQCINKKKLNHLDVPGSEWITTDCDVCKAMKTECLMTIKDAIEPKKAKPAKSVPKSKPKKEKYQYLLIDWDDVPPTDIVAFPTKKELLEDITDRAFTQKHTDLEIYKLTPVSHKAEIKVEVKE